VRDRMRQQAAEQQRRSVGRQAVPSPSAARGGRRPDGSPVARPDNTGRQIGEMTSPRSVPQQPGGRGRIRGSEVARPQSRTGPSPGTQGRARIQSAPRPAPTGPAFRGREGGARIQSAPRPRPSGSGPSLSPAPRSVPNATRSAPNATIRSRPLNQSPRGFSSSQMKRSRNLGEVQSMRRAMQQRGGRATSSGNRGGRDRGERGGRGGRR
jgi:hypothetical protein